MINKEFIYNHSPVFGQNFLISAYGLLWKQRRFGGAFKEELRIARMRESYTYQKWLDCQTIQLRKILVHAFEFVPYYREVYKKLGFNLSQLEKFEIYQLSRLPLLQKEDLRKFGLSSLLSSKRSKGLFFQSSGSTGTPVHVFYNSRMHQQIFAIMESRVYNWAKVHHNMRRGMIGGRKIIPLNKQNPPFYRFNTAEKQVYFSAYHISQNNIKSYIEGIEKHKPEFMMGYARSNYFLADLFQKNNFKVEGICAVITSSETLNDAMREKFSEVYGCEVFDSYSGVEACGFISETEHHEKLISPDVGIIEVLDEQGNQVMPGESGEAVCTGLLNFDQPLIRYRIGDIISLAKEQITKCGREMPKIDEIIGRVEDIVVGSDGRRMIPRGILRNFPNVIEGQIIQEEVDSFSIKVVSSEHLDQKEKEIIITRMHSQIGTNIKVEIIEVPSLPREKNGKLRAVVSNIKY